MKAIGALWSAPAAAALLPLVQFCLCRMKSGVDAAALHVGSLEKPCQDGPLWN
jgi:hypothetical protein